jgi:hypothetical protein
MHPRRSLVCLGFAVAAGLGLSHDARAQFSYGYDSFVNVPSAESHYFNMGYQNIYTDPTTVTYANGTAGPMRTIAPYVAPPFNAFQQGNGLPAVSTRPAAVAVAAKPGVVAKPQVVVRRRGLLFRRR